MPIPPSRNRDNSSEETAFSGDRLRDPPRDELDGWGVSFLNRQNTEPWPHYLKNLVQSFLTTVARTHAPGPTETIILLIIIGLKRNQLSEYQAPDRLLFNNYPVLAPASELHFHERSPNFHHPQTVYKFTDMEAAP